MLASVGATSSRLQGIRLDTGIAKVVAASAHYGPSELERLDYLDGWRGLAIALVLFDHFSPSRAYSSGLLGVHIFFCLSGYLMSRILFVKQTTLGTFYRRRISRILPAFLLFVVVIHGIALVVGWSFTPAEFVATATFMRTYLPATPELWESALPIGHLWSLNVEEHCYVLLSLLTLVALIRKREGWVLLALGSAAIGTHLVYARFPAIMPQDFEIRTETAASFLLISAGYVLIRDRYQHLIRQWMPVVATLLAATLYLHAAPWWSPVIVAPFLLAFAVNHLDRAPAAIHRLLAAAPLRLLGLWSYSIYLWQQPFYIYRASFPPGVALLLAMGVSVASFYLFEKPMRTWLNSHWQARPPM